VQVDLLAVARLDEAVVGKQSDDAAVRLRLMGLGIDPQAAGIVFQLPARRIERVAHRDENVLVRVVLRRIAIDYDIVTRVRFIVMRT